MLHVEVNPDHPDPVAYEVSMEIDVVLHMKRE